MARAYLITGTPGVGKTSLILSLLDTLPGTKGGFYTREIREGSQRVGFRVTDLSGREGVLAHVRHPGPPRVGRYGVDLKTFEDIGVQAVSRAMHEADLIVIVGDRRWVVPRRADDGLGCVNRENGLEVFVLDILRQMPVERGVDRFDLIATCFVPMASREQQTAGEKSRRQGREDDEMARHIVGAEL